jgi:hypothetical protein
VKAERIPTLCCACQFVGVAPEGGYCPRCGAGPAQGSSLRVHKIGGMPIKIPTDPIGRLDALRNSRPAEQFVDCRPSMTEIPRQGAVPRVTAIRRTGSRESPNARGDTAVRRSDELDAANRALDKARERRHARIRDLMADGLTPAQIAVRMTMERDQKDKLLGLQIRRPINPRTVERNIKAMKPPANGPSARQLDEPPD